MCSIKANLELVIQFYVSDFQIHQTVMNVYPERTFSTIEIMIRKNTLNT